ncbi:MAG: helix-turn-helix transcriptional regulator [Anaerolineaceae bacterium]|jgi:DNA-binding PadR family transcriptional regulator|nr:helix-turn-helix transcriptional regulator [Anaerolineaceae bacterium]
MARRTAPISMEYVIMALLDEEPTHGYELHQRLSQMPGISKIWNVKQALFYSKLERLEASGFIEQDPTQKEEGASGRVVFQLTDKGKQSLLDWISTPVLKARDIRQVFLGKLIVARRFGHEQAIDLIQQQRQVNQGWYDHLLSEMPETSEETMDEFFVHSYRQYRDLATLHWLDYLESQIRKIAGEETPLSED